MSTLVKLERHAKTDHAVISAVTTKLLATAANLALADLVRRAAARTAVCPRVMYAALAVPIVPVAPLATANTAPMVAPLVAAQAVAALMMMITVTLAVPAAPVVLKAQAALLRLSMVSLLPRLLLPSL